jgi:hypothetical protein
MNFLRKQLRHLPVLLVGTGAAMAPRRTLPPHFDRGRIIEIQRLP